MKARWKRALAFAGAMAVVVAVSASVVVLPTFNWKPPKSVRIEVGQTLPEFSAAAGRLCAIWVQPLEEVLGVNEKTAVHLLPDGRLLLVETEEGRVRSLNLVNQADLASRDLNSQKVEQLIMSRDRIEASKVPNDMGGLRDGSPLALALQILWQGGAIDVTMYEGGIVTSEDDTWVEMYSVFQCGLVPWSTKRIYWRMHRKTGELQFRSGPVVARELVRGSCSGTDRQLDPRRRR